MLGFGPEGLVAYIVTFHPLSLILGAIVGAATLLPYAIIVRGRKGTGRYLGALALFLGVTLLSHAFYSWAKNMRAFSVEVVQLAPLPEERPPGEARPEAEEGAAPRME